MNIPYVKHFDENGTLLNPINGSYSPRFETRQQRRNTKSRPFGNGKSKSSVFILGGKSNSNDPATPVVKQKRRLQRMNGKTIVHYYY